MCPEQIKPSTYAFFNLSTFLKCTLLCAVGCVQFGFRVPPSPWGEKAPCERAQKRSAGRNTFLGHNHYSVPCHLWVANLLFKIVSLPIIRTVKSGHSFCRSSSSWSQVQLLSTRLSWEVTQKNMVGAALGTTFANQHFSKAVSPYPPPQVPKKLEKSPCLWAVIQGYGEIFPRPQHQCKPQPSV